ncbi:MAG: SDR family NAD(P)-dependent oxidoreductase [Candidatus Eisenbacteria bacterium]
MTDSLASLRSLFDLTGCVVVITGGGRGIGLALARGMGAHGARIVIGELDRARGESAAERLRAEGVDALAIETDVTKEASVDALLDRCAAERGGVDVWINNAG